jgi:hypothetical protein
LIVVDCNYLILPIALNDLDKGSIKLEIFTYFLFLTKWNISTTPTLKTIETFVSYCLLNLSNLYPSDGPTYLLLQVRLVCPWVLHNGQITVLVFRTFGAAIDCDSILFFCFLPLKVSTTGGAKGLIQRSLITVARTGSSPSAYICLKYSTV